MPILEIDSLTRRFGAFTAVDHLSLQVGEREIFGLLGPNGAGKSTTIKMLTTLLPPTEGSARVGGNDIVRQAGRVRQQIGYVPQAVSVDGALTGRENLLIFAKLYDVPAGERSARIDEALDLVGLREASERLVKEYSGGMIRRLEIAQSVMNRPRLLFMDEPTVGLDPLARAAVWQHVRMLRDRYGVTVFLTTHYMDEADELCDRIAIMHRGKVAVSGTPDELKAGVAVADASLDDVFARYAGEGPDEPLGNLTQTRRSRKVARRLG